MFFLKRQLKNAAKATKPSAEFRARLMSELRVAYDQAYGCPQRRPILVRAAAVGLASLALFFTVGTGVYAYESPKVTQGHPLYFVKSGLERVRERAAASPESRAQFHAQMMDRRLQEGEYLLPERPDHVPPSLDAAAEQFERSIQALEEGVDDEAVRKNVIETLSIRRARYLELSARVEEGEGENGGLESLRMRIQGHELSEQELKRLFGSPRRAPEAVMGQ